ncbi:MAG: PEP-CTERM sorting domain-containing protein [Planctomycetes bacterium]|nr:PEP-CTERM sorting domain-containing protein [Planctomycetota bacterium]
MDAEYYSTNIFKPIQAISKYFVRYIGIVLLTAIIFPGLANNAKATSMLSDFSRASTYIDSQWYYFLDHGQYQYLDRGQYHLIGELNYFLGHQFYPRLYEKDLDQKIRFTNILNKGWFMFLDEQFPVNEHPLKNNYYFNAQDSIDRQHYHFSDKGQYNYLEKRQYDLLGGLNYSYRYPFYRRQLGEGIETIDVVTNPEPSTIGIFGLGAVWLIVLRKKRRALVAA